MVRNGDVPELLETFMEECGETERWITVNEFRNYFDLDVFSSPTIAGFLRRIHRGPFFSCPYKVERIEKIFLKTPHHRVIKRYLVKRRPHAGKRSTAQEREDVIHDHPVPETRKPHPRDTLLIHAGKKKRMSSTAPQREMQDFSGGEIFTDSCALTVFNNVLGKKKESEDNKRKC